MLHSLKASVLAAALCLPAAAHAETAGVVSANAVYADGAYTVTWTLTRRGAADVYAAARPGVPLSATTRVATHGAAGLATMVDPLGPGVRPYFYVVPQGAKTGTWTATRVVPLQGASNFRDLGGYATEDGHRVAWGVLFRSNGLSNLTDGDYRTIDGLGVKSVVDLRTDQERTAQPTQWKGEAPNFYQSPKPGVDSEMRNLFGQGRPEAAKVTAAMIGFYRTMPDAYAEEFRAMFQRLLAGQTPIIVHCTAGKDRTGVASALILSALGVPRATIVADYAMSQDLLYHRAQQQSLPAASAKPDPTQAMMAHLPPDVAKALLASDPAYIEAALDHASAEYGSVDGYLEKRLGVGPGERAALRARYLQPGKVG